MNEKQKNEQKEKQDIAKKQLKVISDIEDSIKTESIVKDNKIQFKSGEKTYRVRKLNFPERNEIQEVRRTHYLKLIKADDMLFRKQWVALYKEKDIDINKMEDDIKRKQEEIKSLLLRLVKVQDIKSIQTLKEDISRLRSEQYDIVIEKTDLLKFCIEDQLLLHVNTYTTYLCLERQEGDKWIRNFETFDEFEKCTDADLMPKAFEYISVLIYGEDYNESQDTEKTS